MQHKTVQHKTRIRQDQAPYFVNFKSEPDSKSPARLTTKAAYSINVYSSSSSTCSSKCDLEFFCFAISSSSSANIQSFWSLSSC